MEQDNSIGKVIKFAHVLAASFTGLIAAATSGNRRLASPVVGDPKNIIPYLNRTGSGRVGEIEKFSHYVARQLGFEDGSSVPELCILAEEYLRKSKGCDESIYEYISRANENEVNTDSLYMKLVHEFERCILTYFSFHWNQATYVISQVLRIESQPKNKLKEIVLAATRKQRFERVTKSLKVARVFSTLAEQMKAINIKIDSQTMNDTVPTADSNVLSVESSKKIVLKKILLAATRVQRFERVTKNLKVARVFFTLVEEMKAINGDSLYTGMMVHMAFNQRSPVLLFMGGSMGAGKSTVLKDILKEPFWSGAASNAVVVKVDAFMESDDDDMLQTAELVHQSSTDAASSLLVTALNEGRDVIMDGTLSWEPFVEQTIAMARNIHKYRYRMGVGYKVAEDGTVTENYWEQVNEAKEEPRMRKPYRIELVGVVCDGYLAVVRGIRRAIMTGTAMRVNSQLKSHKRFAKAFPRYCKLVDNARLYCTNAVGGPQKLIGWKDSGHNLLVVPEDIKCLKMLGNLNAEADSIYELHKEPSPIMEPGSVWNDIVLLPSRPSDQKELRETIQKIEKSIRKM